MLTLRRCVQFIKDTGADCGGLFINYCHAITGGGLEFSGQRAYLFTSTSEIKWGSIKWNWLHTLSYICILSTLSHSNWYASQIASCLWAQDIEKCLSNIPTMQTLLSDCSKLVALSLPTKNNSVQISSFLIIRGKILLQNKNIHLHITDNP